MQLNVYHAVYSTAAPEFRLSYVSVNCLAGWIHLKLVEKANEGKLAAYPDSDQRREKSGVSAAIERLEENLSK